MQLAGVSRSARQTDTYQTDRSPKLLPSLPLFDNSTRFTTPFYRNTRPTNVIAIFDGNESRQLCRCQTAKEGCTFTEKHVSLFLRSTLISHTFLYPPAHLRSPTSTPSHSPLCTDRRQQRPHHGTPSLPSPADHPLPLRPLRPARSGRRSTGMR